eukprot:5171817-Prymnesium_polylepis.1
MSTVGAGWFPFGYGHAARYFREQRSVEQQDTTTSRLFTVCNLSVGAASARSGGGWDRPK